MVSMYLRLPCLFGQKVRTEKSRNYPYTKTFGTFSWNDAAHGMNFLGVFIVGLTAKLGFGNAQMAHTTRRALPIGEVIWAVGSWDFRTHPTTH